MLLFLFAFNDGSIWHEVFPNLWHILYLFKPYDVPCAKNTVCFGILHVIYNHSDVGIVSNKHAGSPTVFHLEGFNIYGLY